MPVELRIPEVGESVSEAQIGRWLVAQGQYVHKDQTIAELETDKVTVELPAPASGTLARLLKNKGDSAAVGEVIGYIEEGPAPANHSPSTPAAPAPADAAASTSSPSPPPIVMPAARRALDDHRLDPSDVPATGPGGRLLKEDVLAHASRPPGPNPAPANAPPSAPAAPAPGAAKPDTALGRQEETVRMTPLRRRIAQRLIEAQQVAALLTTFNEIDMTAVIALRKQYQPLFEERYKVKLGFMSFFVKAVVDALKQFPELNAEVRDEDIVYRNYYDMGIAISTERGLLVPVLRDADRLSFAEIELAIADLGQRARANRIALDELQGGTFTITNGGVFGSLMSTPIVNPPQSGVLGMHAIQERPVAREGNVVIRPMMYVALTYDHRIVDGRQSVSFLRRVKDLVEEPSRLLLEI